jgi:membrane protein CcdC involved in cytochrome C biogenesis
METTNKSIERIGVTTGLITSLLLVSYFSLMKALGLATVPELRYFNFFILLGGILYAYEQFRTPGNNIEYLSGMGLGFITTVASVVPFAAFIYAYFTYVDPGLLATIKSNSLMGEYLTPFTVTGAIVIEGLASGVIISFVLMQYYKSAYDRNDKKWLRRKHHEII